MHELSLAIEILKTALEQGEANSALRINDIHLEANSPTAFTHINPDNIQSYFDLVSKGTIAEGAELSIEFTNEAADSEDPQQYSSPLEDDLDEELELIESQSLILKSMRIEKP